MTSSKTLFRRSISPFQNVQLTDLVRIIVDNDTVVVIFVGENEGFLKSKLTI